MPRILPNIDFNKKIGGKLRELRLAKGLTQKMLAAKIDVSFQQLQKYEIGSNRITADKLFILAKELGVSVDSFGGGKDEAGVALVHLGALTSTVHHLQTLPFRQQSALCNIIRMMAEGA